MNGPRGMPTNGEKQFCDWLNHTRSMADVWAAEAQRLEAAKARRQAEEQPRGRFARSPAGKLPYAGFDPYEAKHKFTWGES